METRLWSLIRSFQASAISCQPWPFLALAWIVLTASLACEVERRKSDAELGLTPRQAEGRHLYDQYCDRCHAPYSSRGRQGPPMKGIFKKPYMSISGLPANDERVEDIIRIGRNKMQGFGNVLTEEQIQALLAYMHTL